MCPNRWGGTTRVDPINAAAEPFTTVCYKNVLYTLLRSKAKGGGKRPAK
jgi:hypothetical protein